MVLNLKKMILYIILITPITTLLQGVPVFSNINKFFLGVLIVLLAYANMHKLKRNNVYILFLTLIVWLNSYLNINRKFLNINDLFYFWMWILLFIYLENNMKELTDLLYRNIRVLRTVIIIWTLLVVASIGYSNAFYYEWGSSTYFKSFADNAFRFATTCMFIIVLLGVYVNFKKDRKYLWLAMVPIVGVAASGSRTYLFLVLLLFAPLYYKNVSKEVFWVTCIPVFLAIISIIVNSNMMDKFDYVNYVGVINNKSFLSTFTSGRTDFWLLDLKAFFGCPFWNILFGNSITYSYEINSTYYTTAIQAHNDYINVLISYGLIGLCVYLVVFLKFLKRTLKNFMSIEKKYVFIFLLVYILNAFMNGVMAYLGATLSLPFILIMYSNNKGCKVVKKR